MDTARENVCGLHANPSKAHSKPVLLVNTTEEIDRLADAVLRIRRR